MILIKTFLVSAKTIKNYVAASKLHFNPLTTNVPTIEKPVSWFALQIK